MPHANEGNSVSQSTKVKPVVVFSQENVRQQIKARMHDQHVTANALAVKLESKVGRRTIYDFMEGKYDVNNDILQAMVSVLAGTIRWEICWSDSFGEEWLLPDPLCFDPLGDRWKRAKKELAKEKRTQAANTPPSYAADPTPKEQPATDCQNPSD